MPIMTLHLHWGVGDIISMILQWQYHIRPMNLFTKVSQNNFYLIVYLMALTWCGDYFTKNFTSHCLVFNDAYQRNTRWRSPLDLTGNYDTWFISPIALKYIKTHFFTTDLTDSVASLKPTQFSILNTIQYSSCTTVVNHHFVLKSLSGSLPQPNTWVDK